MVLGHKHTTERGLRLIKSFEGFSPTRYLCSAGVWTIAWGHAIRRGEKWDQPNATITEEEAETLLKQDIYSAEASVSRLIKVTLEDSQFDSLVSFCFNLGSGALQASTLRSMLNREEYFEASLQFDRWVWGGGRKLPGLIRRRKAERILFQTGVLYI